MATEVAIELAYNLLKELNIRHMKVLKDHLELDYIIGNQQIIAFGNTEDELVENFYYLYQELVNPA